MPDAIVDVQGYVVTISGTVAPHLTVNVLFQMDGQADIQASATADANGNISGSQTLPAAGLWNATLFLPHFAESFLITIPGGRATGPGVLAVPTGSGQPQRFQLSADSIIGDKDKANALRRKAKLPPVQ